MNGLITPCYETCKQDGYHNAHRSRGGKRTVWGEGVNKHLFTWPHHRCPHNLWTGRVSSLFIRVSLVCSISFRKNLHWIFKSTVLKSIPFCSILWKWYGFITWYKTVFLFLVFSLAYYSVLVTFPLGPIIYLDFNTNKWCKKINGKNLSKFKISKYWLRKPLFEHKGGIIKNIMIALVNTTIAKMNFVWNY